MKNSNKLITSIKFFNATANVSFEANNLPVGDLLLHYTGDDIDFDYEDHEQKECFEDNAKYFHDKILEKAEMYAIQEHVEVDLESINGIMDLFKIGLGAQIHDYFAAKKV